MKFAPKTAFLLTACSISLTTCAIAQPATAPTATAPVVTAPTSNPQSSSSSTGSVAVDAPSSLSFATAPALTDAGLVKRRVLQNGATLVTQVDRTSPRISFSVQIRAGAADETSANAGWRRLLAEAILRASIQNGVTRTFAALNRQVEDLGGRLGASVSDDAIEFSVSGESANANALLDLLLQALRSPRLNDDDVTAARQILNARREAASDNVTTIATTALGAQLFQDDKGAPLAYGLPFLGTNDTLDSLTSTRLRQLHAQFFQTARVTIGATGDLDEINLRSRTEAFAFPLTPNSPSNAPSNTPDNAPLFAVRTTTKPIVIAQISLLPGDWVFVSYRLGQARDADAPALSVLAAVLGASPNAPLAKRLLNALATSEIEKASGNKAPRQPLAQQVSAALTPRRFGGDLTVFALTGGGTAEQLRQTMLDEAKRLRDTPLSESELAAARRYAIGDWMTSGESLHDRAFRLASDELLGVYQPNTTWPLRLQNVSAADVQSAAQRYLNNETVVVVRAVS